MVRFGVIGTNWITESFIEAASQVDGFQLTAIYSRTEEKAKEFASKYSVETTYTDLEKMAASKDVDAVYIASPNSLHAEQSILFMNHKKHVLCEKPMASNKRETEMMVDSARKNKVLLMEALKTTHAPNFQVIKENIHKLGPIRRYFASYCQYSSRYDKFKDGQVFNAFDPTFSSGSLLDIGIYCIYPLVALFGEPNEIRATGYKLSTGVDGQGSLALGYDEMDAVVMHSKITDSSIPSEIQGENGTMVLNKMNTPDHIEIQYRNGRKEVLSVPQESNTMIYEAKHFIECIRKNIVESPINTYSHSVITAGIMEEARKQMGIVYPADRN